MTIDSRRHPRGPVLAEDVVASLDSQHEVARISILTLPDRNNGPDMQLVRVSIETRSRGRASRLFGPLHARRLVRAIREAGFRAFGDEWIARLDSPEEAERDEATALDRSNGARAERAERARAAYAARAAARAEPAEPEDVEPPAEPKALDRDPTLFASPPRPSRTTHVDRPRPPGVPRGSVSPRRSP